MRRNRSFVLCCTDTIGKSQRTLIFVLYADQHFNKRVNLGDMRNVGIYGFKSITLSFICILPDRPRQFGRLGRINLKGIVKLSAIFATIAGALDLKQP